eukprot:2479601-Pyramimonas_sp.AAC.1
MAILLRLSSSLSETPNKSEPYTAPAKGPPQKPSNIYDQGPPDGPEASWSSSAQPQLSLLTWPSGL